MTGAKPDEKIRTPMQWSDEKSAGFSAKFPWQSVNSDFTEKNVAVQTDDPASLLNTYRRLIQLRNNHVALRIGNFVPVEISNNAVLAFLRVHEDEIILVVLNLGSRVLDDLTLSLAEGLASGSYHAYVLLGTGEPGELLVDEQGGFADYQPTTTLPASSSLIIQLRK